MLRVATAILIAGCGGAPPSPQDPPAAPDHDAASIAGITLPSLPPDIRLDDEVLSPGSTRATDALSMPTPRPPEGDAAEVQAWADAELGEWLARRAQAAGDAQHALEGARTSDDAHSVVASAILGLVYSRFALDLRGIPTPTIFAGSDRAHVFREALEQAARPLWQRAMDAFGSCASLAAAAPAYSLAAWRTYCDREIREAEDMLPEPAHGSREQGAEHRQVE